LGTVHRSVCGSAVITNSLSVRGEITGRSGAGGLKVTAQRDRDVHLRESAVWALGEIGHREAATVLGAVLACDSDPCVRGTAAWALGEIRDPAALPALRTAIKREKNSKARRAQVRALIQTGEPAEAMRTGLLDSSDPEVLEAVVRGLAGRSAAKPWPLPRPRPFP